MAPTMRQLTSVTFERITKLFGNVEVLHGVSFELEPSEIHALIGENGAGKSTLMKILGGYQPATSGEIGLGGQAVHFRSSRDAEDAGIVLIHQEFNLAEDLTVAQNMFLGHEQGGLLLDDRRMNEAARQALAALGVNNIAPGTRVPGAERSSEATGGDRQGPVAKCPAADHG